jgi:ribosome maturation protein Sdo1
MPSEQATKVIYKSGETEFFVIANPGMVCKWRKDKTIPLIDVVQNFDIHTTTTGSNTGEAIHPSNGMLESAFGTTNKDDIVKKIVNEGEEKGY